MCGYRSKRLGTTSHSARRLVRVFMITHVKQRRAKKIDIDQLQVGMYMEADVKEGAKGGASKKGVLLLGKGVLITTENQIRRLKAAGLGEVTIDTTKGKDVPGGRPVAPVAVPQPPRERRAKPLPEGRTVPYKDEIKMARKTQGSGYQGA